MSDTPRTDAEIREEDTGYNGMVVVVSPDFARQLERENASLRDQLTRLTADHATVTEELTEAKEELAEANEMLETADADAAKFYEDTHKKLMAAVEAIRTAEGWSDKEFASVHDRIWWLAATRSIDDYETRATKAEAALAEALERVKALEETGDTMAEAVKTLTYYTEKGNPGLACERTGWITGTEMDAHREALKSYTAIRAAR